MDEVSFYTALFSAKIVNHGLHLFKSAGTSLPGLVAMKLSKNFLSFLADYCENDIVTITGTNGKTTTAGLLANILKTAQKRVLHNEKGANMLTGIASSLAVSYKPQSKFDYAVLESDEAYLTKLYDYINANYLLVTNLFHDQVDRYSEIDVTAKKIQNAIDKNPNLKLFVNADDPMLMELGKANKKIFFGFENVKFETTIQETQTPPEIVPCACESALSYSERYYAHIGKYYCEACGYRRPELDYKGYVVIHEDYSEIFVKFYSDDEEKELRFKTNLVGLYNAYNALAAISMSLELGVDVASIQTGLDTYKTAFGRAEKLMIDGKNVLVQLIKNPTGANEVLRTVNKNTTQSLMIAINDNIADGRDISWLWDTDFELLADYPNNIIVSGLRADDMASRLKKAGFSEERIEVKKEVKTAFNYALSKVNDGGQMLVMPTYTALLEMQKFLPAKR